MSKYILSCCSTADLSKEYFESRDIHYICFHYMLGDTSYPDDLGQSVPFDEFYARMAAGEMTKTSQVNVEEFVDYFEGFLKQGYDILHVSLSSGLSYQIPIVSLILKTDGDLILKTRWGFGIKDRR